MVDLVRLEHTLFTAVFAAYLVGTVLYFVFISLRREGAASVGRLFLIGGAAVHTVAIVLRGFNSGHAPFSNMFESLSFFAWGIIIIFLVAERKYKLTALGAFTTPVAVLIMGYASLLSKEAAPLVPALQSYWLWIHVITCFAAYAAFAVSFSTALMYYARKENNFRATSIVLILACSLIDFSLLYHHHFNLAELTQNLRYYVIFSASSLVIAASIVNLALLSFRVRPGEKLIEIFPAAKDLDNISYRLVNFAFPFLSLGIITGAVWANYAWGRPWSWDPKETWSLITWFVYAVYLHARITAGWKGRRAAFLNVTGFVSVIFTYFGVNFILSGLHSYG